MDFKEHIIEKIVDITGLEREVVEKSVEVPPGYFSAKVRNLFCKL